MLSLTPNEVDQVGEYCVANTTPLPHCLLEHSVTTANKTERNGEMAGSLAQCAYLMSTARGLRPKRGMISALVTMLVAFLTVTISSGARHIHGCYVAGIIRSDSGHRF